MARYIAVMGCRNFAWRAMFVRTEAEPLDDPAQFAEMEFKLFREERELLIDAARESARTFDKAVLAFGSAVFGFSIAFVKDIAPQPLLDTLGWLGASWTLFSFGLLAILLSFLFSHQACMFEIEVAEKALGKAALARRRNPWSVATTCCNALCVAFLFSGLLCWSVFAYKNLRYGGAPMGKVTAPTEKRGYAPPPGPAKQQPTPPAPQPKPPAPQRTPKK